jgi:hypothetical protein
MSNFVNDYDDGFFLNKHKYITLKNLKILKKGSYLSIWDSRLVPSTLVHVDLMSVASG